MKPVPACLVLPVNEICHSDSEFLHSCEFTLYSYRNAGLVKHTEEAVNYISLHFGACTIVCRINMLGEAADNKPVSQSNFN